MLEIICIEETKKQHAPLMRAAKSSTRPIRVGYGDELMATGLARGANARGKRIAFGDGRRLIKGPHADIIFRGNPNIATGALRGPDIEWCDHYSGHRRYNRPPQNGHWIWNLDFRPTPGEMFFDDHETAFARTVGEGFVVIEPNVPAHKSWTVNKQWPQERYQAVADTLLTSGHDVAQFDSGKPSCKLAGVRQIATPSFRHALAALERAALYIGPEGGLHHGAAAVGTKAVVIFGGFIPPRIVGYQSHVNLSVGDEFCGSMKACQHCAACMDAIGADLVLRSARELLGR